MIKTIFNPSTVVALSFCFMMTTACDGEKIDACKDSESSEDCNSCCKEEGYSGSSYVSSAEEEPCTCVSLDFDN